MHTLFIESTRSTLPLSPRSLSLWGLQKTVAKYAILIHLAIPHENMFKPFLSAHKTFAYQPQFVLLCAFIPFQSPPPFPSLRFPSYLVFVLFLHTYFFNRCIVRFMFTLSSLPPSLSLPLSASVCFNLAAFFVSGFFQHIC